MKSKQEFRVPLSSAALALLGSLPRTGELVFPGRKADSPQSDMTLTAVLRRMEREDISVHGFRSTFRDWCSESLTNSFPHEVIEQALAHTLPNKVEAAYRRGDLLAKRAMLMQAWADYCGARHTSAIVTSISQKAA
jgi:integrase